MKKNLLLLLIIIAFKINAQYGCFNALTFCSGTTYTNSTISNNTSSSGGMSFGCITNFNHNCFYYGQAQNNGSVTLQVTGSSNMDLICWGGVNGPQNICSQLMTNTLACSSSSSTTESITFNIVSGKFYLICATTPASTTTQFTLSQISGSGILCINECSKAVATPTLCYVSSNSNLNNEIYFNNYINTYKNGTVIYRENSSSLWDSIGYVPNGQPDKFIDLTSNTNQQSYRYAIAHLDSCNNIQLKSSPHKTILLQSSQGTGTQINLSWNLYQGLNPASYYIFRGTTSSNMQVINTVSGSTTAYTDLTPPVGLNLYKVAILTPTNCTSSAAAMDTIISSNYRSSQDVGIIEQESNYIIDIYPNPTDHKVFIQTKELSKSISIIDITGKEILTLKPKNTLEYIEFENLSAGIYFIRITSNNKIYYRKIVLN
ncbi:MAG: hypothetical protein C0448_04605 [Sphingobacteriaceae bacterium]|nr:hypothetical protein [Sphingobacteriaceae bacterium]